MLNIASQIASELGVQEQQILNTIDLLNEGATIPFISRYRKEVTGGLDDAQLRIFETRYIYLLDLEDRKNTILKSIEEQGKLTPELEEKIANCLVKSDLEDIYLPYKPKRQTKATKAKEAGLEPLALELFYSDNANLDLDEAVAKYLVEEYPTTKDALNGSLYIMMDHFSENADLLAQLKSYLKSSAVLKTKVIEGKEEEGVKFRDYFDYQEAFATMKSYRLLALLRARKEGIINLTMDANPHQQLINPAEAIIREFANKDKVLDLESDTPLNTWRNQVLSWTWKVKLESSLETQIITMFREVAEEEAIKVFAYNLKSLLLASPAKAQVILGLDPGIRTGVKCAVVDQTAKVLDTTTLYMSFNNEVTKCREVLKD